MCLAREYQYIQFFKAITITEATAIGTELREYFEICRNKSQTMSLALFDDLVTDFISVCNAYMKYSAVR